MNSLYRKRRYEAQTVTVLGLISLAVLIVVCSVKSRTQIDKTLPAVVLQASGKADSVTTVHIQGELVKQLGKLDEFVGYVELGDLPFTSQNFNYVILTLSAVDRQLYCSNLIYGYGNVHDMIDFGVLYVDKQFEHVFIIPSEQNHAFAYMAPSESQEEAVLLLQNYGLTELP